MESNREKFGDDIIGTTTSVAFRSAATCFERSVISFHDMIDATRSIVDIYVSRFYDIIVGF